MINVHHNTEREVFKHLDNKDWDAAIQSAKKVPYNFDVWQQMPSYKSLPNDTVHKILDHLENPALKDSLNSFLWEYGQNLPIDASKSVLQRAASHVKDDFMTREKIMGHPNFEHTPDDERMKAPAAFWHSYEARVRPHHFAVIKSHFSGKPEDIEDHRGEKANSHNAYVYDDGMYTPTDQSTVQHMKKPGMIASTANPEDSYYAAKTEHILPHLNDYAKKIQSEIMKDEFIKKRTFNNEPYIKLYRGVGGHYGHGIKQALNHDPETKEIDQMKITVPTAHLTSWSTDPKIAERFALSRGDIPGQPNNHGIVMEKWVPVKHVLHSGHHSIFPGQEHKHENESEIVVGHPHGSITIDSKNLKFQDPHVDQMAADTFHEGNTRIKKSVPNLVQFGDFKIDLTEDSLKKVEDKFKGVVGFRPARIQPYSIIAAEDINRQIQMGHIHDLSHFGHFTKNSFIVGNDPMNSWLMKLEPKNKPGIKSVKHTGPQVVKEAAFYNLAYDVFGLASQIPHACLGSIDKDKAPHHVVAIKMLPDNFKLAQDLEGQEKRSFTDVLAKFTQDGTVHKISTMFYILGEGDSHGGNVMTNGIHMQMIDHGSSFANEQFDPAKDEDIFIPYILRFGKVRSAMTKEQKLEAMPRIRNAQAEVDLKHWILTLDGDLMQREMNLFGLDPRPALMRLEKIKNLIKQSKYADIVINSIWVYGLDEVEHALNEK